MIDFPGKIVHRNRKATRSNSRRGTILVLGACLLAALGPTPADAQSQDSHTISGGSTTATVAGLTFNFNNTWVDNPGYRPLRVTITPGGTPLSDRDITIVVEARNGWHSDGNLTVEEDVTIPADASAVRRTISIPDSPYTHEYVISVLENGARWATPLPITLPYDTPLRQSPFDERIPRILFAGDTPPDTHALAQYYGLVTKVVSQSPGSSTQFPLGLIVPSGASSFELLPLGFTLPPGDLPTRWIDYTALDVVCLSLDQLKELSDQRPDAARAILAWTRAGGTLWLYGTGSAGRRLDDAEALVGLKSAAWRTPKADDYGKCPKWITWANDGSVVMVEDHEYDGKDEFQKLWTWSRKAPAPPAEPPFRIRDLGFGQVIALAAEGPFPGDPWQWGWIARTMDRRSNWSTRHGIAPDMDENPEFWNFLVPGVGLAPVVEFRVLISLFVLLIGPVNYAVLRRAKRLHLLVLTIPGGALLVTGILFGYALWSDGLDVKVRARSVTRIDQGHAVCWARLSYYAGLAPGGGLRFSDDVAVLPYPADVEAAAETQRVVVWNEGQRLTDGWLASRTLTQYFTIRSRPTGRGLSIEPPAGDVAGVKIANRLGAAVESLAIRDRDGNYYWADDLPSGGSTTARPITEAKVADRLRKILADNEPTYPPGAGNNPNSYNGPFSMGSRYYYGYGTQSFVSSQISLMELSVNAVRVPGQIEPGSYVAVVRTQPELEWGATGVVEAGSFHLVLGTW